MAENRDENKELNDSLNSTFALFFGSDDDNNDGACECGSRDGLSVLYRNEVTGKPQMECGACRETRLAERERKSAAEAERINEIAWRDEWEQE